MKLSIFLALSGTILSLSVLGAEQALPDKVTFNKHIRPIFSSTCFNCHGPDKSKGKLQLHTYDLATKKRGKKQDVQAIIPGNGKASEVVKRINFAQDDEDVMPPADYHIQLTAYEKKLIAKWIDQGAKYEAHWSYTPVPKFPAGNVSKTIDQLIIKELKVQGFKSRNKLESKEVLIRRLSFDLRGYPPNPKEIADFVNDKSSNAWEKLVDRYLASPAFGERLGVHWLDLVRYSNSVGFHGDQELRSAPYRDYVINALNDNMPFDQFTREQLAGDLLPNPTQDQLIATAYNRLNKVTKEGGAQAGEYLAKYAADRVQNVSSVWLGSTLGCAECHDHKYDPYTMKDFYSMAAFFADIEQKGVYGGGNNQRFAPEMAILDSQAKTKLAKLEKELAGLKGANKKHEKEISKAIADLKKKGTMVVYTKQMKPMTVRVLARGNWMDKTGEIVQPAVPHFMKQINKKGRANRLDLANWLCSEENPLVARAFINRLWAIYFGHGISKITDDLGSLGEPPVNIELLDYLARQFINSKWNIKQTIKNIMMTETYRLKTDRTAQMIEKDPYNRYLARQSIIRLEAEFIRDTALKVSGLLNYSMGGRNIMPYQAKDYYKSMNFNPFRYKVEKDEQQYRRGVYMHWQRTFLHPFLKNFDAPEREVGICNRTQSNTPLQALTLLNDPTFVEAAKAFAERLMKADDNDLKGQLNWLYKEAFGRNISSSEYTIISTFWTSQYSYFKANQADAQKLLATGNYKVDASLDSAKLAAWTQVSRAIMNQHEFIVRR